MTNRHHHAQTLPVRRSCPRPRMRSLSPRTYGPSPRCIGMPVIARSGFSRRYGYAPRRRSAGAKTALYIAQASAVAEHLIKSRHSTSGGVSATTWQAGSAKSGRVVTRLRAISIGTAGLLRLPAHRQRYLCRGPEAQSHGWRITLRIILAGDTASITIACTRCAARPWYCRRVPGVHSSEKSQTWARISA